MTKQSGNIIIVLTVSLSTILVGIPFALLVVRLKRDPKFKELAQTGALRWLAFLWLIANIGAAAFLLCILLTFRIKLGLI